MLHLPMPNTVANLFHEPDNQCQNLVEERCAMVLSCSKGLGYNLPLNQESIVEWTEEQTKTKNTRKKG